LNKAGAFLAFDSIRNSLGQGKSSLHLPYAMDHGRIVVVNLASGVVGETAARLFGALLLGRLRTAAMGRAKMPVDARRPFHVLIDEAQAFGPASIASLLSEVRKYACSITVATQFLDGLTDTTRAALLGNAGTLAVFRCAPQDAQVLAPNFDRAQQSFNPYSLQELAIGEAMVRSLQFDPASVTIPEPAELRSTEQVTRQSRQHYGRPRPEVESYIMRMLGHQAPKTSTPTPPVDRWPLSLRVLRSAMRQALDEHGTFMASPDGMRTITAVDIQHVRTAFIGLRVADAETADERTATRNKAFHRAVESAQQRRLIAALERDDTQWVWLDQA
jgi:hypothetical protein